MPKILIVDDHPLIRDGLRRTLEDLGTPPPEIGEAASAAEALQLIRGSDWDLVILDITLGMHSGLELIKEFKLLRPRLAILILSIHSDEQYALRAFKAGALGYVTKDSHREELIQAVTQVLQGRRYASPAVAEKLLGSLEREHGDAPHETLSNREFEILGLIASGKTVSEIATLLSLSNKTISTYRSRILAKMGLKTTAELMHYAIHKRLFD